MEQNPENGVLGYVRGEEVGAASQTLPRPGPGQPEQVAVDIDALQLGRVRLTFRLSSYKRGKIIYWHWVIKRADLLEPKPGQQNP